ncbi:MAG: biopolymer transporter ExbD [Kiritimatiellales bacterium]|nr:biopolymer transporter ExbD [Kiritimatiellales bacterium]
MKFKIPVEGGDDEINMAPMIDMVFLLLIFFMVASHLTALERIPVPLPVAGRAKVPEEARNRQLITIRSDDESGEDVKIYMALKEMTVEELTPIMTELYEENEELQVYLRADRYVKHKHVKAVMGACAEAGISDIIFGTFESGN